MNDKIIYIMTPEDLTKALKCLSGEEEIFCKDCAFSHYDHYGVFACKKNVAKAALYFLNRHRAEIERKDRIIESYALRYGTTTDKEVILRKARVEAIKEFAERIHSEIKEARNSNFNAISERVKKHNMDRYEDTFCFYCDGKIHALDGIWYFIDNLVKEMTGETS